MLTLLNKTAELALYLLEKNGGLVPFCKASTITGEPLIIMANVEDEEGPIFEDERRKCEESVWFELKRRISAGEIKEFAFSSDSEIKLQNEPEPRRFLKIEFQNGSEESAVYLFPLTLENGKAQLGRYLTADVPTKLL
jgi:hypothetical protein